ncbi:TSUP family transporter [Kitasatospora sp. NPDC004799]|uniref:TSUP family transporter n=1 Tax=Kitasatospora sp. NPDC004799 TaxID=3154460 RepID=UPI0033B8623C
MPDSCTTELVLGCTVLLGASVQRLAGVGFALVAAPVLVLLLGPGDGVTLSNLAAGAISAVGLLGSWRRVRLTAMLPLTLAAACTVPAGVLVAAAVPAPWLLVGIGALVSLAALLVLRGARAAALRGVGGAPGGGAPRRGRARGGGRGGGRGGVNWWVGGGGGGVRIAAWAIRTGPCS